MDGKQLILKVVNPTENAANVKVTLSGAIKSGKATMQLVAPGDLNAKNSFEQRDAVKPVPSPVTLNTGELDFAMPKWSVGVIEVEAQ
jgi:alpha-L-arabinofuranosidase